MTKISQRKKAGCNKAVLRRVGTNATLHMKCTFTPRQQSRSPLILLRGFHFQNRWPKWHTPKSDIRVLDLYIEITTRKVSAWSYFQCAFLGRFPVKENVHNKFWIKSVEVSATFCTEGTKLSKCGSLFACDRVSLLPIHTYIGAIPLVINAHSRLSIVIKQNYSACVKDESERTCPCPHISPCWCSVWMWPQSFSSSCNKNGF